MEITTLFFTFLAVAALGIVGAIINMIRLLTHSESAGGNVIVIHAISGLFYAIGGIGAVITGIIWIVQCLS